MARLTASVASATSRAPQVSEEPTGASFELKGKGIALSGSVRAPAKDFVAWVYADPVGQRQHAELLDLGPRAARPLTARPSETLRVPGAAAYEFGTRDKDHGIPVQPYPDG